MSVPGSGRKDSCILQDFNLSKPAHKTVSAVLTAVWLFILVIPLSAGGIYSATAGDENEISASCCCDDDLCCDSYDAEESEEDAGACPTPLSVTAAPPVIFNLVLPSSDGLETIPAISLLDTSPAYPIDHPPKISV